MSINGTSSRQQVFKCKAHDDRRNCYINQPTRCPLSNRTGCSGSSAFPTQLLSLSSRTVVTWPLAIGCAIVISHFRTPITGYRNNVATTTHTFELRTQRRRLLNNRNDGTATPREDVENRKPPLGRAYYTIALFRGTSDQALAQRSLVRVADQQQQISTESGSTNIKHTPFSLPPNYSTDLH